MYLLWLACFAPALGTIQFPVLASGSDKVLLQQLDAEITFAPSGDFVQTMLKATRKGLRRLWRHSFEHDSCF